VQQQQLLALPLQDQLLLSHPCQVPHRVHGPRSDRLLQQAVLHGPAAAWHLLGSLLLVPLVLLLLLPCGPGRWDQLQRLKLAHHGTPLLLVLLQLPLLLLHSHQ
jgi:hypothetical protein